MTEDLIVIGAGPAGLAYGYRRLRDDPGLSLSLLESDARYGGRVQTETIDGFCLEFGPQAIRPDPGFLELTSFLGLSDQLIAASDHAKRRWLAKGGRLIPLPAGPLQAIRTQIMSLRGKLRILREPWIPKAEIAEESVEHFVNRRLGPECVPFIQAVVNGIYAGDTRELELESTLPFLARAEADYGSLFRAMIGNKRNKRNERSRASPAKKVALYSFVGGMSRLTSALARFLGDRLTTEQAAVSLGRSSSGWEVTTIDGRCRCAKEVVLTTPAWVSARILESHDPELSADLRAIPFAPVASVYLGYRKEQMAGWQDGFGFLLHPDEEKAVLGAIYCSSIFPDQAPAGTCLIRVMMGGQRHPQLIDAEDEQIANSARDALHDYLGMDAEPIFCHVVRIKRAIPQYILGHAARLRRIGRRLNTHPGLDLRGNSYHGIALGAQLSSQELWRG